MFENRNIWVIIIVILAIIVIYYIFFARNKNNVNSIPITENFTRIYDDLATLKRGSEPLGEDHRTILSTNYNPDDSIEQTTGIENNYVDKMVCHPSCCGDQWPVPFDGLTPEQIQKTLSDQRSGGTFVRTSYTCANGPNGVGCPCVTPQAYLNLANRGQKTDPNPRIEPSLLIQPNKLYSQTASHLSQPAEWLDGTNINNEQVLVDGRKINDLRIQRQQPYLDDVRAYGAY